MLQLYYGKYGKPLG